jgi:hypothetical protein
MSVIPCPQHFWEQEMISPPVTGQSISCCPTNPQQTLLPNQSLYRWPRGIVTYSATRVAGNQRQTRTKKASFNKSCCNYQKVYWFYRHKINVHQSISVVWPANLGGTTNVFVFHNTCTYEQSNTSPVLNFMLSTPLCVAQWLRHWDTNRKVAGPNPSGRTMALGLTPPLTEMSTRNIAWGKGGRSVGLLTLPCSCVYCLKIYEPLPPGTLRACQGLQWDCFTFLPPCAIRNYDTTDPVNTTDTVNTTFIWCVFTKLFSSDMFRPLLAIFRLSDHHTK